MSLPLLGSQTITRKRRGTQTWGADGRPSSAETSSTLTASVQPATGRDLEQLPEGERHKDGVKAYVAPGSLRTADQHGGTAADLITVDGVDYEVQQVKAYSLGPIPHDRALATRVQEAA